MAATEAAAAIGGTAGRMHGAETAVLATLAAGTGVVVLACYSKYLFIAGLGLLAEKLGGKAPTR